MPGLPDLLALLDDAAAGGHPPAIGACAILRGECIHESAHGGSEHGRATVQSVFDVASVTKIAATTLAIAKLGAEGALHLDERVADRLPAFGARGKAAVTVRALLGHRSGLPAWAPLFVDAQEPLEAGDFERARKKVLAGVFDAPLEVPGRRVYSDLGFLALGALIEEVSGIRLDAFVRNSFYRPLNLDLGFVDLSAGASWLDGRYVLPTGTTRPRAPAPGQEALYAVPPQPARPDPGCVDDDNAFAMGGVAGHAGLFGTARALAELGAFIANEVDAPTPLGAALSALLPIDPAEGPARSLGFDRPSGPSSSAGTLLGRAGPRGAIGHLGFTGCSLWIDLDRGLSVALLSNRTYPGREHIAPIRALRPVFHDALCRAID